MLKRIIAAVLWLPLAALAQSYPSPTFNNVTVQGTLSVTGAPAFTVPVPIASGGTGVTSVTQYNVAVGGSNAFAFIGPTATSGIPLVSQGSAAYPAFSTAVPAGGGTGLTTITAHGVMLGEGTSNVATAAPVSAGYVLTDNGPGNDPTFQAGNSGRLIGIQVFTGSGTYTPDTGTNSVIVVAVGGGGAGGGAPSTAAGQQSAGGGGGAGAWTVGRLTTGFSGVTVTIGAAGTGASGAAGGSGGSTSFGTALVAGGGGGGNTISAFANTGSSTSSAGVQGTVSTAGNIASSSGQWGQNVLAVTSSFSGGHGGSGPWGAGGAILFQTTGGIASGHGAGGGGVFNGASQAAMTGGAGTGGIVIVYEYN